ARHASQSECTAPGLTGSPDDHRLSAASWPAADASITAQPDIDSSARSESATNTADATQSEPYSPTSAQHYFGTYAGSESATDSRRPTGTAIAAGRAATAGRRTGAPADPTRSGRWAAVATGARWAGTTDDTQSSRWPIQDATHRIPALFQVERNEHERQLEAGNEVTFRMAFNSRRVSDDRCRTKTTANANPS